MGNEYIIIDAAGKELRREPKGRGRPRKGAEEREPGKFYVVETDVVQAPKKGKDKDEIPSTPIESIDVKTEPTRRKLREIKAQEITTSQRILDSLLPGKRSNEDGKIILSGGNVFVNSGSGLPLERGGFNMVFSKIVIDIPNSTVLLYSLDLETPKYIITEVLTE